MENNITYYDIPKHYPPDGSFERPFSAYNYKGVGGYMVGQRLKEVEEDIPIEITCGSQTITLKQVHPSSEFEYYEGFCYYNNRGNKVRLLEKELPIGMSLNWARWKAIEYINGNVGVNMFVDEFRINLDLSKWIYIPFNGRYYECTDCETEIRSFYTE